MKHELSVVGYFESRPRKAELVQKVLAIDFSTMLHACNVNILLVVWKSINMSQCNLYHMCGRNVIISSNKVILMPATGTEIPTDLGLDNNVGGGTRNTHNRVFDHPGTQTSTESCNISEPHISYTYFAMKIKPRFFLCVYWQYCSNMSYSVE